MSETTLTKPKRKSSADYEALADQLLADMRHLDELMQKDRAEIEYLKAETRLLREESLRLQAETRVALSRLVKVFA